MGKVNFLTKNRDLLEQDKFLAAIVVFVIVFLLFFALQIFPNFPDPDTFYHAKITSLMREGGLVKNFDWLPYTIFRDFFIDHHFLYHLLLLPFVWLLGPLVGIKVATAVFGALLVTFIFWLFKRFEIKGTWFYVLILLLTNPFVFRLNLGKASSLSILFLLLGLYLLFKRKPLGLLILSLFYVWLFNGWPLILVITVLYLIGFSLNSVIQKILKEREKTLSLMPERLIDHFKYSLKRLGNNFIFFIKNIFLGPGNLKLLASCFIGLILGVVINPYFPTNLQFYKLHILEIGLVNYQNIIGVGAEWYPYAPVDLLSSIFLVAILFLIALFTFFILLKKQSGFSWALLLITLFFLVFTFKSRRNIEYLVPFAVFFSALNINNVLKYGLVYDFYIILKELKQKYRALAYTVVIFLIISSSFIVGRDVDSLITRFNKGFPLNSYQAASQWLYKNTPANSLVFHSNWDEFPALFYYNDHNHYIIGMDPTFMYQKEPGLYWDWVKITRGEIKNPYRIIKKRFKADYIFIDKGHKEMRQNIILEQKFRRVYSDEEADIYQVL